MLCALRFRADLPIFGAFPFKYKRGTSISTDWPTSLPQE